uniref:Uncharacterized protein n=1 Tax=Ascaris lumbricoides TaxID=6252 RepID=A0A0M3HSJ6_ASCLU
MLRRLARAHSRDLNAASSAVQYTTHASNRDQLTKIMAMDGGYNLQTILARILQIILTALRPPAVPLTIRGIAFVEIKKCELKS